jgi:hypothetical protein
LELTLLSSYLNGEVGSRDYNTLPIISALNLVLQQHPTRTGVRVGKNRYFFPTSSESFPLSQGLVAFQGFYTSVRPTYKQLMVNVFVIFSHPLSTHLIEQQKQLHDGVHPAGQPCRCFAGFQP